MDAISKAANNQPEASGRRSFLRKLGAATGVAIVTSGAVAHASSAMSPRNSEFESLTPQQRFLLARFSEMNATGQAFMLNMAGFNAHHLPREFPNVTVMPRGAV